MMHGRIRALFRGETPQVFPKSFRVVPFMGRTKGRGEKRWPVVCIVVGPVVSCTWIHGWMDGLMILAICFIAQPGAI